MKTSAPSVDALYRLTLFRVQSPKFFGKAANTPVGTGPFKLSEYVPNDHLTLERFDGYWKPIPSNVKTLTFKFYTDPEAMLNAALAGELDILQFGQLKDAATLEGRGWAAYSAPIADYVMLVLNYTAAGSALANVNIRQAVARAIDRQAIVKNVYFGRVQPITIPMPPSDPTYDREDRRGVGLQPGGRGGVCEEVRPDQACFRAARRQQRSRCAQGGADHPGRPRQDRHHRQHRAEGSRPRW